MKNRKDTETSVESTDVLESIVVRESEEKKTFQTDETHLITSLNKKIQQLEAQLQVTQNKLSIVETRYATLLNLIHMQPKQHMSIDQIIDKVDELEKLYLSNRIQIGKLKGKLLEQQIKREKSTFDTYSDEGLVERKNLGNYFNIEGIRDNRDILHKKRKNSLEEQENAILWEKALDNFYKQKYESSKFRDKTNGLVKKFIPHEKRMEIWPLLFENNLGIDEDFYVSLCEQRQVVTSQVRDQIEKDIQRSFSGKVSPQTKSTISIETQEILEIFSIFRPDISYVQGMTYPVILLTTILGKAKAFRIFANLLSCNKFFRRMFKFQQKYISLCWRVFDHLLKQYQPETYQRLAQLNIRTEIFLVQWFFTLFSRGITLQTSLKIWDMLAYQEQVILYKMGLSIFELIGRRILTTTYEQTIGLVQSYWSYLDENRLMMQVVKHQLSSEKLNRTFQKLSTSLL